MGHRGTVLVVDDDADTREAVTEVLNRRGFAVLTAENGAVALQMLEAFTPSAILLDLAMPVLDGRGFLARRAELPALLAIPVIVASGSAKVANTVAGDERLDKPFSMTALVEAVERACKLRGS